MVTIKKRRRPPKIIAPPKRKRRVSVDLPVAEHRRLKVIAALKGTTLQDLIIECIEESTHTPNLETIEVIKKAEKNEDIVHCKDIDDFIKKLG